MINLLWLVFITFVLVLLQTQVYKRFGFKSLSYKRAFSAGKSKEGESIYLVEEIINRKALPLPWVRLESSIHAALKFQQTTELAVSQGESLQNHSSLFSLMPYTKITRKHPVTCEKRGCYRYTSATVTYGDLLGWVRFPTTVKMDMELLVHPKPLPIKEVPLPSKSWQGDLTVRRWIVEDPFIVQGVRDYQPGDPFHRVNWKATAKTGRLQVRQQDFTADRKLLIYLNFEVDEKMWKEVSDPELIEQGIRYAAAIARQAANAGLAVGFGCNGRSAGGAEKASCRIMPRAGKVHLEAIYDQMARLVIARTVPFEIFLDEDLAQRRSGYDLVVISAFRSGIINERLKKLQKNGNSVSVIPLVHSHKEQAASTEPPAREVKQAYA